MSTEEKEDVLAKLQTRVMNGEQFLKSSKRIEWYDEIKTFESIVTDTEALKSISESELTESRNIWISENDGCSRSCRCCTFCPGGCDADNVLRIWFSFVTFGNILS